MEQINFDYAYSDDACEIDHGIRETICGIRLSILAMGVGLARMREKKLFKKLGFRSMTGYIEKLCIENKMERSSMFSWLSIGEAYFKYQNELDRIGFSDGDGPSKLLYIDRAISNERKEHVFENIKTMSVREFKAFSRKDPDNVRAILNQTENSPAPDINKNETRIIAIGEKMTITGNEVYFGSRLAITLSDKLGRRTGAFLKEVLLAAGEALEEGGILLPYVLHNKDEIRRFRLGANKLLSKIRQGRVV